MSLEKNYRLRGMYSRTNGLGQTLEWAAAVQNLEQGLDGSWQTRKGSDEIATGTVVDASEYQKGGEVIYLTPTGPARRSGTSLVAANAGGNAPSNWTVPVSFGEYSGVLYWADPAGANYLWKYDGYMHYRAGVPKASGTTAAGAGSYYYRVVMFFEDLQGNITWGDYVQFDLKALTATFAMDSMFNTQFWTKSANSSGAQTINQGSPTLNVDAGHNYVAGDYFRYIDANTDVFKVMPISAVGATTITVDFSGDPTAEFSYGGGEPIERRAYYAIFISDNPTFGYYLDSYHFVRSNVATNNITSIGAPGLTGIPMEDVYDATDIKGLPPLMAYLTFYNNVMVMGNRTNTDLLSATDSTTPRDQDTFAWSNLLLGSSVETFAPFDAQVIGKTDEGGISGVFGGDYSLVVMKQRQVYFITGILTGNNFVTINGLTNGVGCSSHKSIVEISGGCAFMSTKGFYVASGQKVNELSDIIEPFLTSNSWGLDLTRCKGVSIPSREKLYFAIPATLQADDVIMVYDYYWKNWSYQYGRSARNGFTKLQDDLVWVQDGSPDSIKTEVAAFNDDGMAINAYWESQFLDLGSASLLKKFVKLILLSMTSTTWTSFIRTYLNWSLGSVGTDTTRDASLASPCDVPLSMDKAYSIKYRVGCNTINQQAVISGLEQQFEAVQISPKADR